jgi:predicted  nucleic acid-binding Zn-ribbon protein
VYAVKDMDKKSKKRLEILRQKLEKTQKLLSAARLQPDEPDEVTNLQAEIDSIKSEIAELKSK